MPFSQDERMLHKGQDLLTQFARRLCGVAHGLSTSQCHGRHAGAVKPSADAASMTRCWPHAQREVVHGTVALL